jgi:regulator of sigma E protease
MGPKIFSRVSKKSGILYSLRLFPIGGYVSMNEDDECADTENAFVKKPVWKRFLIVAAGGLVNITVGFVIMAVFVASSSPLIGTQVAEFKENATSSAYGLEVGDRIVAVNKTRVYSSTELFYEIMHDGTKPVDITVERDGKRVTLENVTFSRDKMDGLEVGLPDFKVYTVKKDLANIVSQTYGQSGLAIRQVWDSIFGMITGKYSISNVSGPVGTTEVIGEAAELGAPYVIYLAAMISINLGIVNLLPIPALDGGRLVFLVIEALRKKRLPNRLEEKINLVGLAMLMLLMIVITFKDIIKLFV